MASAAGDVGSASRVTGSGPDLFSWPEALARAAEIPAASAPAVEWYGLGEASVGIASDDAAFATGFRDVYGDCRATGPRDGAPAVVCTVRSHPELSLAIASFTDPEPLDAVRFVTDLFGTRGLADLGPVAGAWRAVGQRADGAGVWAFDGDRALVRRDKDWQALIANCAVHRAIRLQRGVLFLHAGTVAVGGRGALLIGGKGSGKTTLALAMGAHGHGFLGDEIGAVSLSRREVFPVLRSVSVREGPRDPKVGARLGALRLAPLQLPDGSMRVRARPSAVCGGVVREAVPLRAVVFLDGFASAPAIERVPSRPELLARLNPLVSTLWGMPPGKRAFRAAALLHGPALFRLTAGAPEATADLLARTVEYA